MKNSKSYKNDIKNDITALTDVRQLSKTVYVKSLGFDPYPWQVKILESRSKRIIINAARQAGKSTIVSSLPCHIARYKAKSLSIVLAPTERQAAEDMEKIKGFIQSDVTYPKIERSSDSLIKLDNGSRIVVVPATETAARGYSCPDLVLMDEASRIDDIVYTSGVKPMFTNNVDGVLVLLSTPAGKKGFFHEIWTKEGSWKRYEVRSPWTPVMDENGVTLVPYGDEVEYTQRRANDGIWACFSPRHRREEEQRDNMIEMGSQMYLQEYCCEFVETSASVFSNASIQRMKENAAPVLEKEGTRNAPEDPYNFNDAWEAAI